MKIKIYKLFICSVLMVFFLLSITLVACDKKAEEEQPPNNNVDVVGTWYAKEIKIIDNPYNYGGDKITLEVYIKFKEDGTLLNRMVVSVYSAKNDSGWQLADATWRVEGDIIYFSTGKTFVVEDGSFSDYSPQYKVYFHYHKLEE